MPDRPDGLTRRSFLTRTGMAAGAAAVGTAASPVVAAAVPPHAAVEELTIAEMQTAMESGELTSLALTEAYLERIKALDRGSVDLRSFNEVNPDARAIARNMDRERREGSVRGPLHGIPIVIKENIDTDDAMLTTAGSLALVDSSSGADATVAARLRDAGAVIIGKANLSEWANFRSFQSSSGWSARGGQCRNPYVLDRNPCGSSSGSGAAVSANLAAASLGTETDGSIVCPGTTNGVVGIKPTVGLTSRAGVVPISRSQDTVGPLGRTVADAAAVLGPLTGVDPRDPYTAASEGNSFTDYTQFLDPNGLAGARIGVARELFFFSPETEAAMEEAVAALAALGATVVDPISFPSFAEFSTSPAEFDVLLFEFKTDVALYLETRIGGPKTLADLIAFNNANAAAEMTWFGQEIFELCGDLRAAHRPRLPPGAGGLAPDLTGRGHRRGDGRRGARRHRGADRLAVVAHRPHQRRPLPRGFVVVRRHGGVPAGDGPDGHLVRPAGRDHVHGAGVERADPDQAGERVRGGRGGEDEARVPVDAARPRADPAAPARGR